MSRPRPGASDSKKRAKASSPMLTSPADTIRRLLRENVQATIDGESVQISVLKAILLKLYALAMAGNTRATAVLRQYRELVSVETDRRLDIEFADNQGNLSDGDRSKGDRHE